MIALRPFARVQRALFRGITERVHLNCGVPLDAGPTRRSATSSTTAEEHWFGKSGRVGMIALRPFARVQRALFRGITERVHLNCGVPLDAGPTRRSATSSTTAEEHWFGKPGRVGMVALRPFDCVQAGALPRDNRAGLPEL
jgi:hypothetical protein